jgi:hypothetical protein
MANDNEVEVDNGEKKIEIHLSSDDDDNDPKNKRMKSLANIIATTAALVTAVGALLKPTDTTVTEKSYSQLKTAIEHTAQDVKQNHDDMVALHNYLLGYYAGDQFSLPPLSSSTIVVDAGAMVSGMASAAQPPVSVPTSLTVPIPSPTPQPHASKPKANPQTITMRIAPPPMAAPAAPPPEIHPQAGTTVPDFASAKK